MGKELVGRTTDGQEWEEDSSGGRIIGRHDTRVYNDQEQTQVKECVACEGRGSEPYQAGL